MCRLKILLTSIVSLLSTWFFAWIMSETWYWKIIMGSIHMKNTPSKKKKPKTVHLLRNLGVCHLSFIGICCHELTAVEFHVAHTDSGQNPALTSISQKLPDLRPHRAKISRSYCIITHWQLRTTLQLRTFLKAFSVFPLWKDALLVKSRISLYSLHFGAGLQTAI